MYSHPESNSLAASFRSLDARTSRLEGLESASQIAHLYCNDPYLTEEKNREYAAVIKSTLAMLIAREKKRPRKVGIPKRRGKK